MNGWLIFAIALTLDAGAPAAAQSGWRTSIAPAEAPAAVFRKLRRESSRCLRVIAIASGERILRFSGARVLRRSGSGSWVHGCGFMGSFLGSDSAACADVEDSESVGSSRLMPGVQA